MLSQAWEYLLGGEFTRRCAEEGDTSAEDNRALDALHEVKKKGLRGSYCHLRSSESVLAAENIRMPLELMKFLQYIDYDMICTCDIADYLCAMSTTFW